jgi:hypothetical protein
MNKNKKIPENDKQPLAHAYELRCFKNLRAS